MKEIRTDFRVYFSICSWIPGCSSKDCEDRTRSGKERTGKRTKENTTKLKSKGKRSEGRDVGRLQHGAASLPPSQERCATRRWCKAALGGEEEEEEEGFGWGEGREKCGTYSSMSPPAPSLRSSPSSLSLLSQKGNAVLFAESQN